MSRGREQLFGVIPIRQAAGGARVLLVHSTHGFWSLPKGHAEKGENPREAAAREFEEETGITDFEFLDGEPLFDEYTFTRGGRMVEKRVAYFPVRVLRPNLVLQRSEVDDARWVSFDQACIKATFQSTKELLVRAREYLGLK